MCAQSAFPNTSMYLFPYRGPNRRYCLRSLKMLPSCLTFFGLERITQQRGVPANDETVDENLPGFGNWIHIGWLDWARDFAGKCW